MAIFERVPLAPGEKPKRDEDGNPIPQLRFLSTGLEQHNATVKAAMRAINPNLSLDERRAATEVLRTALANKPADATGPKWAAWRRALWMAEQMNREPAP